MDPVALPPRAGAQGEACGLMAIKAAISAKGEANSRKIVLVRSRRMGQIRPLLRARGLRCGRFLRALDPAEVEKSSGPMSRLSC